MASPPFCLANNRKFQTAVCSLWSHGVCRVICGIFSRCNCTCGRYCMSGHVEICQTLLSNIYELYLIGTLLGCLTQMLHDGQLSDSQTNVIPNISQFCIQVQAGNIIYLGTYLFKLLWVINNATFHQQGLQIGCLSNRDIRNPIHSVTKLPKNTNSWIIIDMKNILDH